MTLVLPEPNYIDRDPVRIVNDTIAYYQEASGKTLFPAQPERLMVDVVAYRELMTRIGFQEAAKQNLVQYATGAILEHLGKFFAVERLPARKARTTLRFTADNEARPAALEIPAGTRIRSKDQKTTFETLADVVIELSEESKTVEADAVIAGAAANNYPPGEISEPLTAIAFLLNVRNTVLTERGADTETDEQLRQRVIAAPESFSVAGSREAYRFWAFTAHPSVIDVAVESRIPGTVQVYPLTTTILPSEQVLTDVREILSDRRVRPLCDTVQVLAPVLKPFQIRAQVTLLDAAMPIETKYRIDAALSEYAALLRKRLGRDLVPNQIISRIQAVSGVYNVELLEPSGIVRVAEREVADCQSIAITLTPPISEEALV